MAPIPRNDYLRAGHSFCGMTEQSKSFRSGDRSIIVQPHSHMHLGPGLDLRQRTRLESTAGGGRGAKHGPSQHVEI